MNRYTDLLFLILLEICMIITRSIINFKMVRYHKLNFFEKFLVLQLNDYILICMYEKHDIEKYF